MNFLTDLGPGEWTAIGTAIAAIVSAFGGLIYKYRTSKKIDFSGATKIWEESQKMIQIIKGNKKKKSK